MSGFICKPVQSKLKCWLSLASFRPWLDRIRRNSFVSVFVNLYVSFSTAAGISDMYVSSSPSSPRPLPLPQPPLFSSMPDEELALARSLTAALPKAPDMLLTKRLLPSPFCSHSPSPCSPSPTLDMECSLDESESFGWFLNRFLYTFRLAGGNLHRERPDSDERRWFFTTMLLGFGMHFSGFSGWMWLDSGDRSLRLANACVRKTRTAFFEPSGPPVIHGFDAAASLADRSSVDLPLKQWKWKINSSILTGGNGGMKVVGCDWGFYRFTKEKFLQIELCRRQLIGWLWTKVGDSS